ncbi:unnamed protein product [Closterium sp. NIES-53]
MAFTSPTLANPITPLHLEADGTSSNFKAWSYGVEKHLLGRDVQGLNLKDVLLNCGKGKQPPLPSEATGPASDADMRAYEDAVDKFRKWEKADATIFNVFISSTPPELVNTFDNYPTSSAIWKYLQDHFMNKTAVGVAILIPTIYIAKVQTIHGELKDLGAVFPEQAPAAAFFVGLTSAYEITRKMLLTSLAEDLTFAKVSSALLSAEKDSTAQAKAYALRAPVPQASVALAPFQCNRFPPCTYVVKYGNRKGQVCGGNNHSLATCFKKDEWYAIHGVDKKPPNWMHPCKANLVEVQDPASASANYSAPADADITPCSCCSFANPTILYHRRLGHSNFHTLADMASKKPFLGLPASLPPPSDSPTPSCLDCTKSKLCQQPHPASPSIAAAPLDLVHMNVWALAPVPAQGGRHYFLAIVDDHSRYVSVHLLHAKAEAQEAIMAWVTQAQTTFNRKVKHLHSYGGGEFCNDKLKAFCSSEGILQNFTLLDSSQQNSIADRSLPPQSLPRSSLSLSLSWDTPSTMLPYSTPTRIFPTPLLPHSGSGKQPLPAPSASGGAPPMSSSTIRLDGSKAVNSAPRLKRASTLGTTPTPLTTSSSTPSLNNESGVATWSLMRPALSTPPWGRIPPPDHPISCGHEELCDLHAVSHIFPDITKSPSLNFSKNPTIPIPLTVQEALSGPHAAEWCAAMEAECESFTGSHSFDDKTPPPGVNIIGSKWLFRVKQLPDKAPVFKACYVAKGFTQQQYFDFFKTFSPTSKPPTIHTLLDVAAREDFEIKSMDTSSTFLQGHLKETVFMDRPEGFPGDFPSNTVWKLNCPVCGLKKAPREWHNKVKEVLLSLDFHPLSADPTLFIRRHSEPFYILVYVDEFIFIAKDLAQMTSVQEALSKALLMKDLGDLKHYLGMEITRDRQARTISLS